jgi:predicted acylesterase/phospholipase RssA
MASERRLAISIKGGVSLGAYEAGALFETLRLIQYNNSLPVDESTRWYIDVLSGASAGSITAAIVALALINQNSNYLYTFGFNNSPSPRFYRRPIRRIPLIIITCSTRPGSMRWPINTLLFQAVPIGIPRCEVKMRNCGCALRFPG